MKLKKYPKYKDSGIPWIGKIPEEWEINKLKHNVYALEKSGLEASEGEDEGIYPFFTSSQLQSKFIENATFNNECLIMGTGGFASVHYYNGKFSISNDCLVLKKQKVINMKFLYYQVFNNLQVINDLGFWGTGLRHLQKYFLYSMLVFWPNKPEQIAIANFLDKKIDQIDVLIEKDQKLIELLKEKRTALINHAVTKGLDPNVKLKDSGIPWIGKIPEGWEVIKLKYISQIILGQSPNSNDVNNEEKGFPFFQGKAEFGRLYPTIKYWTTSPTKIAQEKDVLMSVRAPVGSLNISNTRCCIGRGLASLRHENFKYFYYLLHVTEHEINMLSTGSTFEAISGDVLKSLYVPYSNVFDEQTAIANYLDKATAKIDRTIQKIEQKINLLEEYKKSLIHNVVTGKIDVRGAE